MKQFSTLLEVWVAKPKLKFLGKHVFDSTLTLLLEFASNSGEGKWLFLKRVFETSNSKGEGDLWKVIFIKTSHEKCT